MKKEAFTLAEVLITLAIVGVVAAVSLPTLNTNVQKQGLSSQIAKFYNQYTKAIEMYKVDNELDEIPDSFEPEAFVRKYFKVTQKCSAIRGPHIIGRPQTYNSTCFAQAYRTIDSADAFVRGGDLEGHGSGEDETSAVTYMLADGAVMTVDGDKVIFDVNGLKGPNISGYDLQQFTVYHDGSIDEAGVSPELKMDDPDEVKNVVSTAFANCKAGASEGGCFGHLLRNGFRFNF